MTQQHGRTIEVETLTEFDELVGDGARSMDGWHLQSLDLSGRTEQLAALEVAGAVFLGCRFADGVEGELRARGALLFPTLPDVPVDVYRAHLYSPQELYQGLETSYEHTPDAKAYAWSRRAHTLDVTLTQALHDHSIDDALAEHVAGRSLVGVMGGHSAPRGSPRYADAARLGHVLGAAGHLVCTGGGPGAMEAANLGAYLAGRDGDVLTDAVDGLARTPGFHPSVTDWARSAFDVLGRWPDGAPSLGVPSWHYGHEPPNAFATDIAKYFRNATREDILLHVCTAGIVFLPGAGGTVQEIFQDACENYYADEATVAPMVLVGGSYWTETVPAWPLLRSLSRGRVMESAVHLVDHPDEVPPLLTAR